MNGPGQIDGSGDVAVKGGAGARNLTGRPAQICAGIALMWLAFHFATAFDALQWLRPSFGSDNSTAFGWRLAGPLHLLFALALSAIAFPLFAASRRRAPAAYDWLLVALALLFAGYLMFLNARGVVAVSDPDLWVLTGGVGLLGLGVYRSAGLPLLIVTALIAFYLFFGDRDFMPDAARWSGIGAGSAMQHLWLGTEGVFGRPLEVCATLVFSLVVLGALMDRAGGSAYVVKCALSLVGHVKGGAVHAAAISSLVSGFTSAGSTQAVIRASRETMPFMVRTGVPARSAAALDVSTAANGQLVPPVMGAAIFVIADATGLGWGAIALHALLPAAVAYIALLAMIRSQAVDADLAALSRAPAKHAASMAYLRLAIGLILITAAAALAVHGREPLSGTTPGGGTGAMWALWLAAYLVLICVAARRPDFERDIPDGPVPELGSFGATAMTGLYHLLPLAMFFWWLGTGGEPARGAAHAAAAMLIVAATHHPLKALLRRQMDYLPESVRRGADDCLDGLVTGARLMVPVVIASAAAGLVLGALSLGDLSGMLSAAVTWIAGGRVWGLLIVLALLSMILGLGLPSAAAYLVVATTVVPLISGLGADMGLVAPIIAVHLFAFWFAVLGNNLPMLGQSANAAAAILRGDPVAIGARACGLDLRIIVLPFFFLLVPELLLIGLEPLRAAPVVLAAGFAAIALGALLKRYFVTQNRWWETGVLAVVVVSLLAPRLWLDRIEPSYETVQPERLFAFVAGLPEGARVTLIVSGPDGAGEVVSTTIVVPLGEKGGGVRRLERAGLTANLDGRHAILERPFPGTAFSHLRDRFDFDGTRRVEVSEIRLAAGTGWPREAVYLPAMILLLCLVLLQRRRRVRIETAAENEVI